MIEDQLKELSTYLIDKGLEAEILYRYEKSNLVRCGRNQISLNNHQSRENFKITLQKNKKSITGETSNSDQSTEALKVFCDKLAEQLEFLPENEFLKGFQPLADNYESVNQISEDKRVITSEEVVQVIKIIGTFFEGKKVELSGAISYGQSGYAITNTNSKDVYSWQGEDYNLELVLQLNDHNKKEIRVSDTGQHFKEVDIKSLISRLNRDYLIKTSSSQIKVHPDTYSVVFSADAFAEMMAYMSWIGLNGTSFLYETGMFKKSQFKMGDKAFSDQLTIVDSPSMFNREIGKNGIHRQVKEYIKYGNVNNFAFSDKQTCDRFDTLQNTDFNTSELTIFPGDGPINFGEIVDRSKSKLLYISYLHYLNFTNKSLGEFTGTTRFGTYLLEKGELQGHTPNLRVNDSFFRLLNNITWFSSETIPINLSNSYNMRSPMVIHCPKYTLIEGVPITSSV